MKVKVIKYEVYPKENPTSYAVGFNMALENGRSFFLDTLVGFEEITSGMVDEEIANLAFGKIENIVTEKINELSYAQPSMVGIEFNIDGEYENSAVALKGEVDELVVKVEDNSKLTTDIIEAQYNESLNLMIAIAELYEMSMVE